MKYRIINIDALRGVAVLLVIWHHFFEMTSTNSENFILRCISQFFIIFGASGVQIFFILSGFIIFRQASTRSDQFRFQDFMFERYTRLWPGIFLVGISAIPLLELKRWAFCILPSITLLHPLLFNKALDAMGFFWFSDVMWTLFSEIRFYVLFAIVFSLLRNCSFHTKAKVLIIFFMVGKFLAHLPLGESIHNIAEMITLSRDSTYFGLGLALAIISEEETRRIVIRFKLVIVISFAVIIEMFTVNPVFEFYYFVIPLTVLAVNVKVSNKLLKRFAKYVGTPSYISYLLHLNTFYLTEIYVGYKSATFYLIILPFLIIVLSYFLHRNFELPAIRHLRRLYLKTKTLGQTKPQQGNLY